MSGKEKASGTYDRKPPTPRKPIEVAGDLVRRGDSLSIEAAKVIRDSPVEDLAMLVRRLVRSLWLIDRNHPVAAKAMDYLKRHNLQGSVIRTMETQSDG